MIADIPVCYSLHHLSGVVPLPGGELSSFSIFAGKKGVACAGIADPDSFFSALEREGLDLAAKVAFRDHCSYDQRDRDEIRRVMAESGADYLVTTEKDGVKLASYRDDFCSCLCSGS